MPVATQRLKIVRLRKNAVLPRYMSAGAAGCDLSACMEEPIELLPGQRAAVPTGLSLAIPPGFEGQVRPRSGLARRHGLTVANAPGTIDSDYRGEVQVLLINLGQESVRIGSGDRIAQLVIAPVAQLAFEEVSELEESARGSGGFGSTGIGGGEEQ